MPKPCAVFLLLGSLAGFFAQHDLVVDQIEDNAVIGTERRQLLQIGLDENPLPLAPAATLFVEYLVHKPQRDGGAAILWLIHGSNRPGPAHGRPGPWRGPVSSATRPGCCRAARQWRPSRGLLCAIRAIRALRRRAADRLSAAIPLPPRSGSGLRRRRRTAPRPFQPAEHAGNLGTGAAGCAPAWRVCCAQWPRVTSRPAPAPRCRIALQPFARRNWRIPTGKCPSSRARAPAANR